MLRQVEIDGRNGCNCINTACFCMCSQLHGIGSVVAGNVCNYSQLAFCLGHYSLKYCLSLVSMLINTFTRGTAYINTLNAFFHEVPCKSFCIFRRNVSGCVIASVKSWDNSLIFGDIFHDIQLPFF